jgi:DNA polymerase (family 10)
MNNQQLADVFSDIAARLDIEGEENVFAIRAYQRAAESIAASPRALAEIYKESGLKGLEAVSGIGKEIAKKIESFVTTGKLEFYEKLKTRVPDGVAAMLQVPSVGPKKVKQFWVELNVTSIAELEAAARAGKLRNLPKMGEKAEQKIIAGIESLKRRATGRMRIGDVLPLALEIKAALQKLTDVKKIEYAGSLRRMKETIGDVDFVVATNNPEPVMQAFRALPMVQEVLGAGGTKSSVRLNNGLQVDLRAVQPKHWGCAMQYFTGSQQHNIRVREIAQKLGYSLNEYSLTRIKDGKDLFFETEEALYAKLGLAYIEPELREDRGEIDAANIHLTAARSRPTGEREVVSTLPTLITQNDLCGDLQMHTTWSDGKTDVMGMAEAAIKRGYAYVLITDHTAGLGIVNGLTPERIQQQRQEIDRVNAALKKRKIKFTVLQGAEVEVRSDGSLDLPDEVLATLDLVQASVHTSLTQPREKITERAIRAMSNPHIDILGHPSGRMINEREGADYDWEALFKAAAQYDVALEINANPERLDLDDVHARRAVALGCKLTISTDAHGPEMMAHMNFGIGVARRAWVTAANVLNTWKLEELLKWAQQKSKK